MIDSCSIDRNHNFTNLLTTNKRNTLTTDSTADADVKSALLRPDDSSEQGKSALLRTDASSKEDSYQAVNVRPYNAHVTDEDNDSNQDEFRENDNDNDNDSDSDDDDDDDDYEGEPDYQAGVTG